MRAACTAAGYARRCVNRWPHFADRRSRALTMAGDQQQPPTAVLRDTSREDVARRYTQGEQADLAAVTPRIRALFLGAEDESRTRKPNTFSTPDPCAMCATVP